MAKIKQLKTAADKSITHRAIIISSLANGTVEVKNPLLSADTLRSLKAMQMLGVDIETVGGSFIVKGRGKYALKEPDDVLYMGNSGTSARLISGVLAANGFFSVISGDESLRKRPMGRVIKPLSMMGASIWARNNDLLPMAIRGCKPDGIVYEMPVASAQVKSAILLAGLYSDERVGVIEPKKSRDHTENMLKVFGVDVEIDGNKVFLGENRELKGGFKINVPSDISSAAFFMVYVALKERGELVLNDVLLNSTRSGILNVFDQASVRYEVLNERIEGFERVGDVLVRYSRDRLKPFVIDGELVPFLIDEIPILSVLAIFCDGVSEIRDAGELRKKESDRIATICEGLRAVGVKVEEFDDGFRIFGKRNYKLNPAVVQTHFDHRIAMSFLVLEAVEGVGIDVSETQSILTSYPNFRDHLSFLSM